MLEHYKKCIYILVSLLCIHCKAPYTFVSEDLVWSQNRKTLVSAHRGGGQYPGYPENCLESFSYIHQKTKAIIECDVRMTKDSVLVLLHDESLERTTTGTGKISKKYWPQIQDLRLKDHLGTVTQHQIPKLTDAIKLGLSKGILYTWDIKRGTALDLVIHTIKTMKAEKISVIIVYNVDDALKVYRLAPGLKLSVPIRNFDEYDRFVSTGIPWSRIVAFTGTRLSDSTLYQRLHDHKVLCILGTLGNLDNKAKVKGDQFYKHLVARGVDVLATDRPIEVHKVFK